MSQQNRAKSNFKEVTASISIISLFILQSLYSPSHAQNFNSIFESPGSSSSGNTGAFSMPPEANFGNLGTSGTTGSNGGLNPNYTPVNTPSMWETILEKLMGRSKSPGEFIVFPKDVPLAKGAGGQTDTTNRASNTNTGTANNQTYKQSLMQLQNQNRANNQTNFSTGQQWGNVQSTSANGGTGNNLTPNFSTPATFDAKSVQANFAGINSQVQSQLTQTQNYAASARNSLNQALSSNNSNAIQQAASEARSYANSAQAAADSASSLASTTSSPIAKTLANQAREQAAQAMNYADQAMAKASARD